MRNLSAMALAALFVPAMALACSLIAFDGQTEFLCFMIPVSVIGLALFVRFARLLFWDLTLRRDFTFRVTKEFLECECPTPLLGDSFKLLFGDLLSLNFL